MDLKDLFGVAVTFVALGVLISFGLNVQTDIRDDFTAATNCGTNSTGGTGGTVTFGGCSAEYNASTNAIQANANVASKLPILGTIVIAAIVVGVLIKAFSM
jgi:hypothetical protein